MDISLRPESTTKSSTKYTKNDAALITICNLENMLLNKACSYLLNTEATKTVLVDIFVRVNGGPNNGAIKLIENVPEIHTVVLYRNPSVTHQESSESKSLEENSLTAYKITVIDPSNFIFSSHLSNFAQSIMDSAGKLIPFTITTIHKTLKVYQPGAKDTGPNFDQYRDCLDLAVKIALGLNMEPQSTLLTYSDIKSSQVICNISNNPEIDNYIIDYKYIVRDKQTSNVSTVRLFNNLEKAIFNNHRIINSCPDHILKFNELERNASDIIKQPKNLTSLLKHLYEHNAECIDIIQDIYQQASAFQDSLAGQIANLYLEGQYE